MSKLIEELIALSGKTEYELSKRIGISPQTMRSMRISKGKVNDKNLQKLISYLRNFTNDSDLLDRLEGK